MASYPSFPQWDGTRLVPRSGRIVRKASNGAVRIRELQSADKLDPTVVHGLLSSADRTTLLAFYAANRATSFTFTAAEDGSTRTCVFADPPYQIDPLPGTSSSFKATVYLLEV
jgi:hypothetical protein